MSVILLLLLRIIAASIYIMIMYPYDYYFDKDHGAGFSSVVFKPSSGKLWGSRRHMGDHYKMLSGQVSDKDLALLCQVSSTSLVLCILVPFHVKFA